MSEEYENPAATSGEYEQPGHYVTPEPTFSSFWPLLVLLAALLIWIAYQDYAVNSQRSLYNQQFQAAIPAINAAQNWQTRYGAVMKDLVDTGAKDPYAAAIAKEAVQAGVQAGLIRINQQAASTNSTTTPADPAAAK